jgi:hypothetical protein
MSTNLHISLGISHQSPEDTQEITDIHGAGGTQKYNLKFFLNYIKSSKSRDLSVFDSTKSTEEVGAHNGTQAF